MNAITLFAGAGGSCQGVKEAGFDVLACFERDDDAVATLKANGLPAIQADLVDYDWSPYAGKVDLIEGGPPCQPFSAAGLGQGEWDPRDCIPAFIDAVAAVRPRFFVMENVRGLTYKKHAAYLATVVERFKALGYTVEWKVLNAADFGVPQTRQRLFIVGRLDGWAIQWPEPTHSKEQWVTMAAALGWTDIVNTRGERKTPGGNDFDPTTKPSWAITEKTRSWKRKKIDWPVLPDTISLQRRQNGAPPIDCCEQPAPTVTVTAVATGQWEVSWPYTAPSTTVAGDPRVTARCHHEADSQGKAPKTTEQVQAGEYLGTEPIKLTPEEAALLQDFLPYWEFVGSRSSCFRQIGNACPRRLTRAVVETLTQSSGSNSFR